MIPKGLKATREMAGKEPPLGLTCLGAQGPPDAGRFVGLVAGGPGIACDAHLEACWAVSRHRLCSPATFFLIP